MKRSERSMKQMVCGVTVSRVGGKVESTLEYEDDKV